MYIVLNGILFRFCPNVNVQLSTLDTMILLLFWIVEIHQQQFVLRIVPSLMSLFWEVSHF